MPLLASAPSVQTIYQAHAEVVPVQPVVQSPVEVVPVPAAVDTPVKGVAVPAANVLASMIFFLSNHGSLFRTYNLLPSLQHYLRRPVHQRHCHHPTLRLHRRNQ